ncbi:hypothetical protein [Frateuria sp. Soil773]|uniref:hypothetical protein n=1 Tax=Frateuria sp. Soil773 TaxID=1736407 RepID=UPI0012FA6F70|nr:hypothetical protein [Frateuria sp. Soil773]
MAASNPLALIVDRSWMIAESAALALESEGFSTLTATQADEAHRLIELHPSLAVLIAHIHLADESESEALVVAAAERYPRLAIVLVSSSVPARPAAMPAAAVTLMKPFGRDQLVAAIREAQRRVAGFSG